MKQEKCMISGIPAIVWGKPVERVYLYVHGKMSSKEAAAEFAAIADARGYQTLSFDLPEHGERAESTELCSFSNGIRDVGMMADYAFDRWRQVSLYGCSLGAWFSLQALGNRPLHSCMFQSPILDMNELIDHMMLWFDISEARLQAEGEIETPVNRMLWEDYRYTRMHPVAAWSVPTQILYGSRDNLQSRQAVDSFCARFACGLTVSEHSEHPFMAPEDGSIVHHWLQKHIGRKDNGNLRLVKLTPEYRQQLFDMMEEWLAVEQDFSPYMIRRNDYRDFAYYLENLEIRQEQDGRVPDSTFFCLDTDRNIFVGAVNIRHYLNDSLLYSGGHIGDGIRPSERRKGYATDMIGLALEECRKLGINRVLMTCDKDNVGSAKSIINNGGILENEVLNEDGEWEQRYWIELE